MVMLFQLMLEHDHETFWLFQFFLQKTVRAGPELRDPHLPPQVSKEPLEVRQALAAAATSSSPLGPRGAGEGNANPVGCIPGWGGKHWS